MILETDTTFVLAGFMLPYPRIPRGWKWLNRASPTTWLLYALSASQLGRNTSPITTPTGQVTTIKQYLIDELGYHHDFIW